MGRFRVYIKPFQDFGEYETDFVEVTDDVLSNIGQLSESLDNSDFDLGIFRNSNFKLTLDNSRGRYSDVRSSDTMFRYKRADSIVKITWAFSTPFFAGTSLAGGGAFVAEEIEIYRGILNDDGAKMNLKDHRLDFTVLGRESIFQRVEVPFASIVAGDTISDILYACLNQTQITGLLGVDLADINPGLDQETDDVAEFENKTFSEILKNLLLSSNSVMVIEDDAVKVKSRTATADVEQTFYGQGAVLGAENIDDMSEISNGASRIINFITWKDTALVVRDESSISIYGVKKKELDFPFFTDDVKRTAIMNAILEEFSSPKQEFILQTPATYECFERRMLDRLSIDYPLVPAQEDVDFPLYGQAQYGTARYPKTLNTFEVLSDDHYKIIGKTLDMKNSKIKFKVREI